MRTRDTSTDGGFSLSDIGLGPGKDVVGHIGEPGASNFAGPTFTASDTSKPSSHSESWSNLSNQLEVSNGSGSGNIDPSKLNNDAQWLRVLSLVVYSGDSATQPQQTPPTTAPGV